MHGVPSLSLKNGRGTLRKNGPAGFVATGPVSCSMALSVGKWADPRAEIEVVNNYIRFALSSPRAPSLAQRRRYVPRRAAVELWVMVSTLRVR